MRVRILQPAGLALALGAALLGGCGSSAGNGVAAKTAAQIVASATAAADGAATVHVSGTITRAGRPLSLDLELFRGKGGQGQITLDGQRIALVAIDPAIYVEGNAAFYRRLVGPAAARLLQGRWLKALPSDGDLSALASLVHLDRLLDLVLADHATLAKGATTTIAGQSVIAVHDASLGGTLYVATTGTPYPVEIVEPAARGGLLLLDRWNEPVTLQAPPNPFSVKQLDRHR
ncbi:MAG TPA: hypothetical protein VKG38_13640 [Solirubrobacteraceae bacterium]|nr:hypothetical protein [Solirubrobacteraceae bacterium]